MDTLNAILHRKSIRKFQNTPIPKEIITDILKAGMAGPSCVNARDWSFLVVENPETLQKMAAANGPAANPLKGAVLGILVCGDLSRAFPPAKDYWVIDGAIAAQNMILAAESYGIGTVWLGTWPQMERVDRQRQLFQLPEYITPHSLIAFGYPAEDPDKSQKPDWEADRVHYESW